MARQLSRGSSGSGPSDTPRRRGRSLSTPRRGGGTPRGASREREGDILSSVLPPLTPRSHSRPGSRAPSPDRGAYPKGTPQPRARGTPKSRRGRTQPEEDEGSAAIERKYLVAAARSIPNEYGTAMASYFVRRPYVPDLEGEDVSPEGRPVWTSLDCVSDSKEYNRRASADDAESLEVVAYVDADGSVFALRGRCDARHGRFEDGPGGFDGEDGGGDEGMEWTAFDDVEGMDKALGRVTYIDVEGNERDYWLGTSAHTECLGSILLFRY